MKNISNTVIRNLLTIIKGRIKNTGYRAWKIGHGSWRMGWGIDGFAVEW